MLGSDKAHPIERLMDSAMAKMKTLVGSDTVVGQPIRTADGVSIIPVTKVTLGFLTGGGEYGDITRQARAEYPFAGGSGGGVSVAPIGFLVSDGKTVKLVGIDDKSAFDRLFETVPDILKGVFGKESEPKIVDKKTMDKVVDKAAKKVKKEINK